MTYHRSFAIALIGAAAFAIGSSFSTSTATAAERELLDLGKIQWYTAAWKDYSIGLPPEKRGTVQATRVQTRSGLENLGKIQWYTAAWKDWSTGFPGSEQAAKQ